MIALARITTTDGQTVIPPEVRSALKVQEGDLLAWELAENGAEARVRRVQPLDHEYLHAVESSMSEWNSPEDEEAYRDL
ncbi:MAG: AbrB family transcriptional regulator [Magnetococcales bacterium]|nr:AbrB family transcriptional regulator [Magnetococcales bacterium]